MRVVFGIGNPGPEYERTRHNVGFRVVDRLATAARARWGSIAGLHAEGTRARVEGREALLVKPLAYVNRCGPVLAALRAREGLALPDLLAVVDDFALPLGRLRLRASGSAGGHNGLASLIDALQSEEFPRLRVGIGDPGGAPAERYVLEPFRPEEVAEVERAVLRAAEAVGAWLRLGLERAMAGVNRRDLDPGEPPA
ncbi:MAG: aminoacyl-tRNA hydrolase [Planctomycetota bacterium]